MSFLRRMPVGALRSSRTRGEGWPGGSFWADGQQVGRNGYLFGETPPPPGQKRKWESWEAMTYISGFVFTAVLVLGLGSAPDTRMSTWARKQAEKELVEELGPDIIKKAEWKQTI